MVRIQEHVGKRLLSFIFACICFVCLFSRDYSPDDDWELALILRYRHKSLLIIKT